jgi:hypothetical protein
LRHSITFCVYLAIAAASDVVLTVPGLPTRTGSRVGTSKAGPEAGDAAFLQLRPGGIFGRFRKSCINQGRPGERSGSDSSRFRIRR